MHITLTDRLTCPRCGPGVGLIVLMDEVADRRVMRGSLGCPVCRTRYPIAGRVADLRVGGGAGGGAEGGNGRARARAEAEDAQAMRVAALLGLNEGTGFVVVDGPHALTVGAALRGVAPDYEPVVVVAEDEAAAAGAAPVSALLADAALPMADSLMRGAAYIGDAPSRERLAELVRVVRPTGRVVLDGADAAQLDDAVRTLEALGAQVRARDAGGLLAVVM
ncbi:MAG TPA: hypothetical protein VF039_01390 [Longimicrobiales bacterium]